jgi:hypothetical protein
MIAKALLPRDSEDYTYQSMIILAKSTEWLQSEQIDIGTFDSFTLEDASLPLMTRSVE